MPKKKAEVILALDVDSFAKAKYFVNKLYPTIKIFKVGMQLFVASGPKVIEYIRKKGGEVFLDLKFFDIPNTVAHAVKSAANLKVKMLTMHILGDVPMIKEAIKVVKSHKGRKPLLIGVTVLTSKETSSSDVLILARIGIESGLDGVVCSAHEAKLLRSKIKRRFKIVTPGIRLKGEGLNDQKRVATVKEAVRAGSNFLVIGRPILKVRDPLSAAKDIIARVK